MLFNHLFIREEKIKRKNTNKKKITHSYSYSAEMQWQKAELIEHVCDIKALQRKEETMLQVVENQSIWKFPFWVFYFHTFIVSVSIIVYFPFLFLNVM